MKPKLKFDLTWILLLIIAVIGLAFASCTPEKRLSRLLHNHPELTKKDSTVVIKNDSIKGVNDSFYFDLDTTQVDPYVAQYKLPKPIPGFTCGILMLHPEDNNGFSLEHLKQDPHLVTTTAIPANKPTFKSQSPDTIVKHFEDSVTVKAWRQGKGIGISITKPPYVIPHIEKVIENKVICDPCTTPAYDYFFRGWFAVTLLLAAFGIYRYASART